jgi:hypothetical protein
VPVQLDCHHIRPVHHHPMHRIKPVPLTVPPPRGPHSIPHV